MKFVARPVLPISSLNHLTKSAGKIGTLEDFFIVLHVFNDIETYRPYKLMTILEIVKF